MNDYGHGAFHTTRAEGCLLRSLAIAATAAVALLAAAALSHGAELTKPDPALTPGSARSQVVADVCRRPLPPRPVISEWYALAHQVMAAYHIPWEEHRKYQLDHLVPRCAGGADTLDNLWPQPIEEALIKDRDEENLCRLLCRSPSYERLIAVQVYFVRGEWR